MSDKNRIIDIPRPLSNDPEVQRFYDSVRTAISQMKDSVTRVIGSRGNGSRVSVVTTSTAGTDTITNGVDCKNAVIPPIVTGIATSGAFGIITLTWELPSYAGAGGVEVWASATNDIATAKLAGVADQAFYQHIVPAIEFTTENGYEVTRYYWLRNTSACDKGNGPWSPMATGKTPASPSLIGELMAKNATIMITKLGLDVTLKDIADKAAKAVEDAAASVQTIADASKKIADDIILAGNAVVLADQKATSADGSATVALKAAANADGAAIAAALSYKDAKGAATLAQSAYTNADGAAIAAALSYKDANGAATLAQSAYTNANGSAIAADLAYKDAKGAATLALASEVSAGKSATTATNTLKSLNDTYGVIVQTSALQTLADLSGKVTGIQAKYAVQTDVNGLIQGFGILNTGSSLTSGMLFNASNFYVTNFTASDMAAYNNYVSQGQAAAAKTLITNSKKTPFMIENGKVYAKELYVKLGSIEGLEAANITLQQVLDKQGTTNLTSGNIQTSNFVSGSTGWKIDYLGNAEFGKLKVRAGQIAAPISASGSNGSNATATNCSAGQFTSVGSASIVAPTGRTSSVIVVASFRTSLMGGTTNTALVGRITLNGVAYSAMQNNAAGEVGVTSTASVSGITSGSSVTVGFSAQPSVTCNVQVNYSVMVV